MIQHAFHSMYGNNGATYSTPKIECRTLTPFQEHWTRRVASRNICTYKSTLPVVALISIAKVSFGQDLKV